MTRTATIPGRGRRGRRAGGSRRSTARMLAPAVLAATAIAACSTAPSPTTGSAEPPAIDPTPAPSTTTHPVPTTAVTPQPSAATVPGPSALPNGDEPVTLDPAAFSTTIDHPYWPMTPGTRWTYRETAEDGEVLTVTVIVTDQTKVTGSGITARVVRDTVRNGREIVEDTFDWYAQDRFGNLWYLGEQTAEFEGGKVVSREGSFEAGVGGAQAGIALPAAPSPGQAYRQEYRAGEAEDRGEVLGVAEFVDTTAGHYPDAILTRDTTPLEPDVLEYKLYARGVGPVLTLTVSGGSGREELIKVDQAPPGAGTGPLGRP
jgi:hypothetical protein